MPADGGVSGDFDRLRDLHGRIAALSESAFRRKLLAGLAEEVEGLILEGFQREETPYGKRWPQSYRARVEGGRTLSDTARLRNSLSIRSTSSEVRVGTNVIYAPVHQYGATIRAKNAPYLRFRLAGARRGKGPWVRTKSVKIPQRQFMPEPNTGGLGPRWTDAFDEFVDELLQKHLGT